MHFYLLFASVLVLGQRCLAHEEAVTRGIGTFHDASDDAVSDINRSFITSSDYCVEILTAYRWTAAEYMSCIVIHAREFNKCRSCCGLYVTADDLYRNITQTQKSDSGSSCFAAYSRQVELVALSQVNDFIQTSWKASLCSYCFMEPLANGSQSTQLSSRASTFFQMLFGFRDCVLSHTKGDFDPFVDRSNGTGNLSVICHECHSNYSQLNDFYQKLEDEDTPICSDMENTMNLSRSLWNDLCHKVVHDVKSMVTVGVMLTFPLVFYIVTAIKGKNPNHMMLTQKRWENVMLTSEPGSLMIDSNSELSDN